MTEQMPLIFWRLNLVVYTLLKEQLTNSRLNQKIEATDSMYEP